MASPRGPNPATMGLLVFNLVLFGAFAIIAGWAVDYGIEETGKTAFEIPARLFPMVYPIGNLATGFFVLFSVVAGAVGGAAALAGIYGVADGGVVGLSSAAAFSVVSWFLTLLAAGVACKEINMGWRMASLRILETMSITLVGTQLLGVGAIYAGLSEASTHYLPTYGRTF